MTVNATGIGGASIKTVNVISVPENHFFTPEMLDRMRAPGLIEHAPVPQLDVVPAGAPESAPDEPQIADAAEEPEPAPEPPIEPEPAPDSVMQRARALGYIPLPRRPRSGY
jgi:hypothetical protein